MNRRWLTLALGLLTVAGLPACKERTEQAVTPMASVKGVTLATLQGESVAESVEAAGTVRARNAAVVAARIPGTVTAVKVREGEAVARGQVLATLEAMESTAGAASAAAGVVEAERALDEARARTSLAESTFERFHRLYQEQAVTRQEFEARATERDVAKQGLARAEARLQQAKEASRAAGAVAGYTRITAPQAGVVSSKQVELGMTVFPGMPLLTVEQGGSYRLEVAAPESLLGKVRPGSRVPVGIDNLPGVSSGVVAEVAPAADPVSRTFNVKLDVAGNGLRSGMFGRAWFPVGSRSGLLVPKGAIIERGALTSVWVVDQGNIARLRLVKVGKTAGERVEVLAGLASGERLAVGGVEKLRDGAKVE